MDDKRETPMEVLNSAHYASLHIEAHNRWILERISRFGGIKSFIKNGFIRNRDFCLSYLSSEERSDFEEARKYKEHMKHMDVLNDPSRRGYDNQANFLEELQREKEERVADARSRTFEDPDHPGTRHSLPMYKKGETRCHRPVMNRRY